MDKVERYVALRGAGKPIPHHLLRAYLDAVQRPKDQPGLHVTAVNVSGRIASQEVIDMFLVADIPFGVIVHIPGQEWREP